MVVPWDPIAKAKWKEFIVALAARYDSNPQLQYLVMTGFQKTGECYLASDAGGHGLSSTPAPSLLVTRRQTVLPAGLVAWEATVKEIVGAIHDLVPQTLRYSSPGPDPTAEIRPVGRDRLAMNDIFAWGLAAYPGRFRDHELPAPC